MVEWITLIIAFLSFVVAVIAEREKLISFWNELTWITQGTTDSWEQQIINIIHFLSRIKFSFLLLTSYAIFTGSSLIIATIFLLQPSNARDGWLIGILAGGILNLLIKLTVEVVRNLSHSLVMDLPYFVVGCVWGLAIGARIMTSPNREFPYIGKLLVSVGFAMPSRPPTYSEREFFFWLAYWLIVWAVATVTAWLLCKIIANPSS